MLYALGGNEGHEGSVEAFDGVEWLDAPEILSKRSRCGAVACGGRLYVIGGYDGRMYLNTVEMFDGKAWHVMPSMPKRRWGCAVVVY